MKGHVIYPELQDRDWLVKAYTTYPIAQIAKMLGCTPESVRIAIHRADIPMHDIPRLSPRSCISCWQDFRPLAGNPLYCSPECKHHGRTPKPETPKSLGEMLKDG